VNSTVALKNSLRDVRSEARNYQVEDRRPCHDGDEIVDVNITASRMVNWKFPRRDGHTGERSFEANTTNRWQVSYRAELERMDQRLRTQWFETEELHGHEPPYGNLIVLEAIRRIPDGWEPSVSETPAAIFNHHQDIQIHHQVHSRQLFEVACGGT
jgi:hypothetical protein